MAPEPNVSILSPASVQMVADSLGAALEPNVAHRLTLDAEYRLRDVLSVASKFMLHAHRTRLTTDDINAALRVKNIDPLFGYSFSGPPKFKAVAAKDIYYIEDQEIDLDELLNTPLPPVPLETTYTAHWLAIEGVQPLIVQNPPPVHDGPGDDHLPVKQILSKELQLYYEKIVDALMSDDEKVRAAALDSLETDPALQPLLPYLIQFVTEKVTKSLKTLKTLWSLLHAFNSLLHNTHIFIEPYLHTLMPTVVTLLVGKRLGAANENHFALRDYAANLASYICHKYGKIYATLQPRLTKTLLKAFLDPTKPLVTQYGAVVGLGALGEEVTKVLVVPNLITFGSYLDQFSGDQVDPQLRADAKKLYNTISSLLVSNSAIIQDIRESKASGRTVEQVVKLVSPRYGIWTGNVVKIQ